MLCYALLPKTLHELVGLWLILPWDHHFYYWRLYFARIKDIVCSGQFWAHTCLSLAQQNTIFSSSHRLIGFVGLPSGIYQPDKPTTVVNYKFQWLIMIYMTLLALGAEAAKTEVWNVLSGFIGFMFMDTASEKVIHASCC